ncbi:MULTISPECIES: carboxymuconolactone decarboxylase family protein [unclassified Pseudomonas]|uniref:carboxymuconolactone decarboxylase family protein n=1 Tax=unclassified Pseudomonas TaxID=196821 RepID=UPI00244819B8|nr:MULTISPECIES: carboxymuconolactone decarboxylase family protein [unclassified Pseudomonas]MDG9931260.1 carboxymuconolactone decarboxylase family protein [Pseudomonas sp. GD04042]MDH0484879.1 carboxymuconolactone decarboxylase family protein [Pseudomonas sp. GD04015]MDH0606961.1 carboxymuconolactone decarboxylase family protein [Pseudomonas sp. GD03869]
MMTSRRNHYHQTAPHVFQAVYTLEKTQNGFSLEAPLRELVKVRASQLNGCALCLDMHSAAALQAGESARRLLALGAWEDALFCRPAVDRLSEIRGQRRHYVDRCG